MMKKLIPREQLEYKPESFPSILSRAELCFRIFLFSRFLPAREQHLYLLSRFAVLLHSSLVDYKARREIRGILLKLRQLHI